MGLIERVGGYLLGLLARSPIFESLDSHLEEVLKGGSIALGMKAAGAVLSFASNVVLARVLGAEGAGVYYLAFTVTNVASVAARLGLDDASLRFISANAASGEWGQVKGVYQQGITISGVVGLGLTGILWLSAPWISGVVFNAPELLEPLRIMTLAVAPHALLILHTQALKGLKRIPQAMLLQGFGVPLLCIPFFLLIATDYGVEGAVGVWASATLLVAFFGRWLWTLVTPDLSGVKSDFSAGVLLSTSLPLFLVASMNLVMNWTDTVMLGIFSGNSEVGVYNVAVKVVGIMNLLVVAVSSIAAPKFSALFEKGKQEDLSGLVRDVTKLLAIGASCLALVFWIIPGPILNIFGDEFTRGGGALRLLAIGHFMNVSLGAASHLLIMTGYEKDMRNITVTVGLTNICLNLLLVPHFGALGAATATGVSLAGMSLAAAVVARRRLSIDVLPI